MFNLMFARTYSGMPRCKIKLILHTQMHMKLKFKKLSECLHVRDISSKVTCEETHQFAPEFIDCLLSHVCKEPQRLKQESKTKYTIIYLNRMY